MAINWLKPTHEMLAGLDAGRREMGREIEERDAEIGALTEELGRLRAALGESVGLQSHYAKLLNAYDGGERLSFTDAEAWLNRLVALRNGGINGDL